jgi:SAM-dependent methyltransferase
MILRNFKPSHSDNRMKKEGDVINARQDYASRRSDNLRRLLYLRFHWMNAYIHPDSIGADIGCGAGFSKEFIRAKKLYLTDFAEHDFLDFKNVDALNLPFADSSLDFLIATNVIHHLPSPMAFFAEARRVLRSGGHLLLFEVQASLLFRFILRLMRHEGYSYDVDVFDANAICTDPVDLWSGNNFIPRLLFDSHQRFLEAVPGWKILKDEPRECLMFLNSGGVTAKTSYVPLPDFALSIVESLDSTLAGLAPNLFALGRAISLQKIEDSRT